MRFPNRVSALILVSLLTACADPPKPPRPVNPYTLREDSAPVEAPEYRAIRKAKRLEVGK